MSRTFDAEAWNALYVSVCRRLASDKLAAKAPQDKAEGLILSTSAATGTGDASAGR